MGGFRTTARSRWLCSAAFAVTLLGVGAQAQELPTGGSVAAGSATIAGGAGALTVKQGSNRAVIDWKSFGIGAGGRVTIEQPGTGSALLNRVTGSDISTIAGSLTSNGQVFLINRNGIVVTPTGTIDTRGGFVGSTLDISNDDFMAGRLRFAGSGAGSILNRGSIAGGAVALLAANVSNEGLIVSPLGRVALGSGEQATLDLSGDGFLQVALPAGTTDADGKPLVSNNGRIESGFVVLKAATAREAVRQAVNMSGVIRATAVSADGGTVVLDGGDGGRVTVAGTVDASGANGGRIDVTGQSVSLEGGSLLATGTVRGGVVRLGGAFQGGSQSTPDTASLWDKFSGRFGAIGLLAAADSTSTDAASLIDVSGGVAGGTAVLWSSASTSQQGAILAGGGGAVEVSSRGHLSFDLPRIAAGAGGTLLLDPKNIFVAPDSQFPSNYTAGTIPAGGTVGYGDPGADPDTTYFRVGDIAMLMEAGTDVVLKANNDLSFSADISISFAANPGDLELRAGRSVDLSGSIALSNASLTVVANDSLANGVVDADRDPGQASISAFNTLLSANAGNTGGRISLTLGTGAGLTNSAIGDIRVGSIDAASIAIDAGASRVRFFNGGYTSALAAITLQAKQDITISGGIEIGSTDAFTATGQTVSWTSETTRTITAQGASPVSFIENGVTTRYGYLSGGNPIRVSLGKGGAYTPIAYGDAAPAAIQLNSASAGFDYNAAATAAAANLNLATTGIPAANSAAGDYSVLTTATPNLAGEVAGYFFNLTGASDLLRITPKLLTPTITPGTYTYGAPTAVVSLAGVINSDVVAPVATLDAAAGTALSANVGGFGFAANVAAGSHSFTLTGLTGTGAGNYALDLSGTTSGALTIARKALTYQIFDASTIYGTLTTPSALLNGGVLGGDVVNLASFVSAGLSTTASAGTYALTGSGLSGAAAANYELAPSGNIDATLTVGRKALTYAATGGSTTYGTALALAAPTLSGLINGDAVSATALLGGSSGGVTSTTSAGTYGVTAALTGPGAGNYLLAGSGNVDGVVTVARKPVSFSVNNATSVYGAPAAVLTLTGLTGEDGAYPILQANGSYVSLLGLSATTYGFNANAGSYSFIFDGLQGGGASNYLLDLGGASRVGTYAVTPKALTYAIDSTTQVYRRTAAAPTVTLAGLVNGDYVLGSGLTANGSSIGDPATDFIPLNVGAYTLAITGLSGPAAGNYMLSPTGNTTGLRTVNPATVVYTFGSTASSTYGSNATLPFASLSNVYFADDVQPLITASRDGAPVTLGTRTPVGVYPLSVTSLTGANAANYVLGSGGNTGSQLTIVPKTITYAVGSESIVYGQAPTVSATLAGVLAGDAVTGVLGQTNGIPNAPVYGLPSPLIPIGRPYYLAVGSLTGADASNYVLGTSGNAIGYLTVTPKPITYSVASSSWVYGDPATVPGAVTLDGLINGETVIVYPVQTTSSGGNTFTGNLTVGTYTQSVPGIDGFGKYTLSPAGNIDGTLTITPKPIGAFVNLVVPSSNVYGDLVPGQNFASANLFGLLANNVQAVITPSPQTASAGGKLRVGTYSFTATGITGPDAFNYTFGGSTTATFAVTPKVLSSAVTNVTTTYGTLPALGAPSLTGIVPGDVVAGGTLAITSSVTRQPVTFAPQTPVGLYYVNVASLTGADASNYSAGAGTGAVRIDRKAITAAGTASTSTYGTLATLTAPVVSGLVGNDQVSAFYTNILNDQGGSGLSFFDRTNVGTYRTTVGGITGEAAGNYLLAATTPGSLVIAPKPLSYTLDYTSTAGVYGTNFTSPLRLQGVLAGESISTRVFASLTAKPANRGDAIGSSYPLDSFALGVGTYSLGAVLRDGGLELNGINAGNYIAPVSGLATGATTLPVATISVTPRAVGYSLTSTPSVSYGTAPTANLTFSTATPGGPLPEYTLVASNGSSTQDLGRNATNDRVTVGSYTVAPVMLGASAYNFTVSGSGVPLTVTPKLLTVGLGASSVTYGDSLRGFLTLPGILSGDAVAPVATFGSTTLTTTADGAGFGLGQVTLNAGTQPFTVTSITGAQAGNYALANSGFGGSLTIVPRTLTFSVAAVTGQYGGITVPDYPILDGKPFTCVGQEFCALSTTAGFTTGAVTFGNILDADRNQVSGKVVLSDGARAFDYAINTPVGDYLQVVSGLQGTKAGNYQLATTGNSAGVMTIRQAWVEANISGGGRVYNSGNPNDYVSIGTPGIASVIRSFGTLSGQDPAQYIRGFVPGDDVSVVVSIFKDGQPFTGGTTFPVGQYEFRPVALTGAQASSYRLVPTGALPGDPNQIGSAPGIFVVSDSSVFGFSFLTNTPSAAYTPPASVTTFTPSINVSGSAQGGGTAGTTQTATSFIATASGGGSAQGSVSVGVASLSAYAGGSAQTLASFGITGVNLSASAQVGASVTLQVGPASLTYAGAASATATATLGVTGLVLQSNADASLSARTAVGGDLGSGVNGGFSSTTSLFATASNTSSASFSNGTLVIGQRSFVGAGGTIGTSGTVSGGAFSGSAGVTLYSPGSLGIGATSKSGYSNGVVTIGFSLGISIGIGGIELAPSFSFDTGMIKDTAVGIGNTVVDVFTGEAFKNKPVQAYCDSACKTQKAADETQGRYNVAAEMLKAAGNKPTMELMGYLAANPDVQQQIKDPLNYVKNSGTSNALSRVLDSYGSLPAQLNDVVSKEQALSKRLQADPKSLTVADLQLAESLRREEATLLRKAADLGGKIVVNNGTISMVGK